MASQILEDAIERATGDKASSLRERTLTATRKIAEQRNKQPMRIKSAFPFIGRGNVLRDCVLTHAQVEAELDNALRD